MLGTIVVATPCFANIRLEEPGRHDDCARSRERRPHPRELAGEKDRRITAPIVHDHRNPTRRRDPDRGRREQMPRPARVRHHVHDFRRPRRTPQAHAVGDEPEHGSQSPHALDPCRPVRGVGLHQRHHASFALQQHLELPRLVGHSAGRRRQRPHQHDRARRRCNGIGVRRVFARGHGHADARSTRAR